LLALALEQAGQKHMLSFIGEVDTIRVEPAP
jgi:hypothetical protein